METKYANLVLKKGRERSILNRHPWIFSGAVQEIIPTDEGSIVKVVSFERKQLGWGFFSAASQIVCRMFDWDAAEPDFETAEYWKMKIESALNLRKQLIASNDTNCYRILHAEGDFLPGIIADKYGNVLVLQVLIKGIEIRLPLIIDALEALGYENIYLKGKTSSRVIENITLKEGWIKGKSELPIEVKENGMRFMIDFEHGQKTGFFLDQRDNRDLLRELSTRKTVLNAFSYTGGFSVAAAAGGSLQVDSVDISKEAIEICNRHMAVNYPAIPHKGIVEDCFEFLKDMQTNYYDLIVLDPPAFAKNAKAIANASRGYKQINLQAIRRIKTGGLLFTFSCSQNISSDLFRKIVFGAAADAHRNVRVLYQLSQPPDHPISIYHPEGEYLKGLVLEVE